MIIYREKKILQLLLHMLHVATNQIRVLQVSGLTKEQIYIVYLQPLTTESFTCQLFNLICTVPRYNTFTYAKVRITQ